MEELLKAGAPVHLQSHDGLSPLRAAAISRNEPVLKFLLEYLQKKGEGLKIDEPDLDGVPLIHTLLVLRDAPMVTTLLEYGASANTRDSHGRSCAHIVAQVIFPTRRISFFQKFYKNHAMYCFQQRFRKFPQIFENFDFNQKSLIKPVLFS